MSKKNSPKSFVLFSLIVLALGGGATYFQYTAVQKAKSKVTELEAVVPSQKELEANLASSSQKLLDYQSKLAHLEGSVPDVAYVPTLLKELEEVGTSHGIKVTAVRPVPQSLMPASATPEEGKTVKKKDYQEIEIEIKGRGRYDDVKSLLDALTTFPKILAVKTINVSPERDLATIGEPFVEATINVVAYVFPFEYVPGQAQGNPQMQAGTQQPAGQQSAVVTGKTQTQKIAKVGGSKHE